MAVRSTQLFGPMAVPVAPASASFVVPADRTAVIRSLVASFTGTVQSAELRAAVTGGGAPVEWWRGPVPGGGSLILPYLVVDPGGVLVFSLGSTPASGTCRVAGFGSLLLGAPS